MALRLAPFLLRAAGPARLCLRAVHDHEDRGREPIIADLLLIVCRPKNITRFIIGTRGAEPITGVTETKAFGLAVRSRRQFLGLSQEALAAVTGLHRTYIGSVERGERNVSLKNIHLLAKSLQTSASHLLVEADALQP